MRRTPNPRRTGRTITRLSLERCEPRILLAGDLYRTLDGSGNNEAHPDWGATGSQLLRILSADYADGISSPTGEGRPSARAISNAVNAQAAPLVNGRQLSDFVWLWGQFIDHDLDLTEPVKPEEELPISVPTGDPFFDPFGTGTAQIDFARSIFDPSTGTDTSNPRQQLNEISTFIDASNVYGSDAARATELRSHYGGRLKTSAGDLLPFNTAGLPNANSTTSSFFLAGDVRANENVLLTAIHTLFVREHNRLAGEIAAERYATADLSAPSVDEAIYQEARRIVGAQLQAITYNEFLPALLGVSQISSYAGYDPTVNPSIANAFSTAAFRVGHTMVSPQLLRLDATGSPTAGGNLALRDAFFNPTEVSAEGIDPLLRGAAAQAMQEVDPYVIDDLRNFLFGPPGAGGFDLPSLNIQRGRDHGLPGYNQARTELGLGPVHDFNQISSDPEIVARLQSVYSDVNEIDLWVGGLAEDQLPGGSLGETFTWIIADQFERLRTGDRFFYAGALPAELVAEINNTRLSDIIERNTSLSGLQENVFFTHDVMTYHVPAGSTMEAVELRKVGGMMQVTDGNSMLAETPEGEVQAIALQGPLDSGEEFAFHVTMQNNLAPAGGITVDGGTRALRTVVINGTDGDDTILVGQQSVEVNGMSVVFGNVDVIRVQGLDGDDQLEIAEGVTLQVLLFGDAGNDTLTGNSANNLLIGGDGHDTLFGRDGEDTLQGGNGDDYLDGGAGFDVLAGDDGNDRLIGYHGDDTITGGAGNDSIEGGTGRDLIYGGVGDDTIDAGGANDIVYGEDGDDHLQGGEGSDRLFGGFGDDILWGQDGHDFLYGQQGADTITGDVGRDLIYGGSEDDWIDAGGNNDLVYAGTGHDRVDGGEGGDKIFGGVGDDVLYGNDGHDRLYGQGGDDLLLGGNGNDELYGGSGTNWLLGGHGDDDLYGAGSMDVLAGGSGADLLAAGDGADWLFGESGDDTLLGGPGDDVLLGGSGVDVYNGGDGSDFLFDEGGLLPETEALQVLLSALILARQKQLVWEQHPHLTDLLMEGWPFPNFDSLDPWAG